LCPTCWPKERLHEWAKYNDRGIAATIAEHTHRKVFENLSLTERRYLESKVKADGVKTCPDEGRDGSNTGPTGATTTPGPAVILSASPGSRSPSRTAHNLRLIEWGQATEENRMTIRRDVLDG